MDLFGWLMTLPIVASALALAWLAVTGSRRALRITLSISVASLLLWGYFAWEFRDGILFGPRTSYGLVAVQRFWIRFWMPLTAWLAFVTVAFAAFRLRRSARGQAEASASQPPA